MSSSQEREFCPEGVRERVCYYLKKVKSPQREVVRSSVGADTIHPLFGGCSRSTTPGMILDVRQMIPQQIFRF